MIPMRTDYGNTHMPARISVAGNTSSPGYTIVVDEPSDDDIFDGLALAGDVQRFRTVPAGSLPTLEEFFRDLNTERDSR